jgi:hypothetical protein
MTEDFNKWWDSEGIAEDNSYREGSPVFWAWEGWQAGVKAEREEGCAECGKKSSDGWALYCVKCSEREWQGLTDEEITELRLKTNDAVATNYVAYKAIEAKLKEKNT